MNYTIPKLPLNLDIEDRAILKQASISHRRLAELKGLAHSIPNEHILINTLTLQEAKDSSEVESIVTTQDDLFKSDLSIREFIDSPAAKEVMRYREALKAGFSLVQKQGLLTGNVIQDVRAILVNGDRSFRTIAGTALRDARGEVVYRPPQDEALIVQLMSNLESYINDDSIDDADALVKMAVIHHQFESIHPFHDGNGRTGRIISVLYLVAEGLLDIPILYLSRYITQNKSEYYRLLQAVRLSNGAAEDWRRWILFMLVGVEQTALHTIDIVKRINTLMSNYKQVIRPAFGKVYKHELLNHLFFHPYTKIEFMEEAMSVQRKTAAKYLEKMVSLGLLTKIKVKQSNYYLNNQLVDLFVNHMSINPNGGSGHEIG